jgi:hypothetical protein
MAMFMGWCSLARPRRSTSSWLKSVHDFVHLLAKTIECTDFVGLQLCSLPQLTSCIRCSLPQLASCILCSLPQLTGCIRCSLPQLTSYIRCTAPSAGAPRMHCTPSCWKVLFTPDQVFADFRSLLFLLFLDEGYCSR